MPTSAIKFDFGSEQIVFYDDEVYFHPDNPVVDSVIAPLQSGKSYTKVYSEPFSIFNITLVHIRESVQQRLDDLATKTGEFTFYPALNYDSTKSINAIFLPFILSQRWSYGGLEANFQTQLIVRESSK